MFNPYFEVYEEPLYQTTVGITPIPKTELTIRVVSHSLNPEQEPYAGMAELYFPDASGWQRYRETIEPDGMERWVSDTETLVLRAHTEMIGIP